MERHTPWFQVLAVVLVVVGLLTLAAPAPAQAMDPQLMMAMASAAGAIALLVGYLIVANGRDKQRAASLEGIYTCGEREASGPMGCGGPGSGKPAPAAYAPSAAPEGPMTTESGSASRPAALAGLDSCYGQASGPMGCDSSGSGKPAPAAYAPSAAPEGPMTTESGGASPPTALGGLNSCYGQASGPMGCGAPIASGPGFSSAAPAPAAPLSTVQGQ